MCGLDATPRHSSPCTNHHINVNINEIVITTCISLNLIDDVMIVSNSVNDVLLPCFSASDFNQLSMSTTSASFVGAVKSERMVSLVTSGRPNPLSGPECNGVTHNYIHSIDDHREPVCFIFQWKHDALFWQKYDLRVMWPNAV